MEDAHWRLVVSCLRPRWDHFQFLTQARVSESCDLFEKFLKKVLAIEEGMLFTEVEDAFETWEISVVRPDIYGKWADFWAVFVQDEDIFWEIKDVFVSTSNSVWPVKVLFECEEVFYI